VATFPKATHAPIAYPFAVVAGEDDGAVDELFAFMTGPEGRAIFARFGFEVP
jgi:molybdate transport system substrate-binding protein